MAIIRHPRIGEYAFGFITSTVILHGSSAGSEELNCVYVPSNHLYIGDMFLISSNDIIRPNLSVREGIGNIFRPTYATKKHMVLHCFLWENCNILVRIFIYFGAEIVISGGMSVPPILTTLDARVSEAIEIAGLKNSTTRVTTPS